MIKDLCRFGLQLFQAHWKLWSILLLVPLLALSVFTRCSPVERTRSVSDPNQAPLQQTQTVSALPIASQAPVIFSLRQTDQQFLVSGKLTSQTSIDQIVTTVKSIAGHQQVINRLTHDAKTPQPSWLSAVSELMLALKGAQAIHLEASDQQVNVSATVASEAAKRQLTQQLQSILTQPVNANITVTQRTPSAATLAALNAAKAANEARRQAAAEASRQAELKRLAEFAEQQIAQQRAAKLAKHDAKQARLAERAATAEAAKRAESIRIAQANQNALKHCQIKLDQLVQHHATLFAKDSDLVLGSGYGLLAMLTLQVNACSQRLKQNNLHIVVTTQASASDTHPLPPLLAMSRAQAVIAYLESINGVYPDLLRPGYQQQITPLSGPMLRFTITKQMELSS